MINFLPQIYENELFYSVLARYRRMCGMVSKRALVEDLYGRYVLVSSSLFPQYVNSFVECLPPTSKITAREIIEKHTLFPFFTSILSQKKSNLIYETMRRGSNGSRNNVEKLIGLGGDKVRKSSYLRYCPVCFKEDMEVLGESYWRTIHQLVGAYYCLKHQVLLKDSSVLSTESGIEFICADKQVCDENLLGDNYSDNIKLLNLQYIYNAELLLRSNFPRKELEYFIGFYIDRLRERRLASKNGSLYMKDIQERFLNFYPKQYLEMMQSNIDPESPSNWIRLFVRNNNKNRSPLRHLLFLQFLGVSLDNLFQSKKVVGRKSVTVQHNPSFDIQKRREQWLQLIQENPGANRSQLKEKGKGLHTWIYRYDRDWYDKVTPKAQLGKEKAGTIDWEKRDEECLRLAREAVEIILQKEGKPIRVTLSGIRNTLGFGPWFHNEKLVKTQQYLEDVKEGIDDFRIRKIKWAIEDRIKKREKLTVYKVQLHAGFGGNNKEVKKLISEILEKGT
ncbi:TnsD family Tn7-like transposition protein [Virgibacillus sp. C22-A2]|uniref:TnsD family Tn7-like transposition protein n=1 Tax=Virgibacillus tibetensis TaxID=3042313 RepID=A0ABU6KG31_9BACI|nr:TnsD family Tn7-like transposition protein [Virgibacillus sp. C22-A2]